jgi:hypothetical protein
MDTRFKKADERKHGKKRERERERERGSVVCEGTRESVRERERIFVYGKKLNNNIPHSKSY